MRQWLRAIKIQPVDQREVRRTQPDTAPQHGQLLFGIRGPVRVVIGRDERAIEITLEQVNLMEQPAPLTVRDSPLVAGMPLLVGDGLQSPGIERSPQHQPQEEAAAEIQQREKQRILGGHG